MCGIVFKIKDRVRLRHVAQSQVEWMGIPWEDYHAGCIGRITYVGTSYCNVSVGGGPAWSIENIYLAPPCIFKKEAT